jgi:hypothetical protein
MRRVEQSVSLLDLGEHKHINTTHKCKNDIRAGVPDLSDGELTELGLDDTGEEFFCKNFLLMFTALNFLGWGAERPAEPLELAVTVVMTVGRIVVADCIGGTEGSSARFSVASTVVLCWTAVVNIASKLLPSDPAALASSLLVDSNSPGVSVSISAIDAS